MASTPRLVRSHRSTRQAQSLRDIAIALSGIRSYSEAGGQIVTDLFQSETEGYLTDPALLERLCAARLESEAEAIRAEG
jgi:ParB family chromosome partitioning protein